jgi:organic hydroperoxide reductase OsmC/OhrA
VELGEASCRLCEANITWTGNRGQGTLAYTAYGRDHVVRAAGKPDLPMSADQAFLGNPARHNPEDLLVVAISSCHML